MWLLYQVIIIIMLPFLLTFILIHSLFKPRELIPYLKKLTLILPDVSKRDPILWIHAVSAGEMASIKESVLLLKDRYSLFLTTSTLTGWMMAKKIVETCQLSSVRLWYFPYDYPFLCRRLLRRVLPKGILFVEGDTWPHFLRESNRMKIPSFLVSGRLGEKEFKGYHLLLSFFKRVFNLYEILSMQSEDDCERMKRLMVDESKVYHDGSFKYDLRISFSEIDQKRSNELILIAASTHPGEESLFLEVYQELILKYPFLKMIIAPRHPERVSSIRKIVEKHCFSVQRVSTVHDLFQLSHWEATGSRHPAQDRMYPKEGRHSESWAMKEIILVDSMGELINFYKIADIVLLGGSFSPKVGGHNPIEPAFLGKPVIVGPFTESQSVIEDFLKDSALIQIGLEKASGFTKRMIFIKELYHTIEQFIQDKNLRDSFGDRAKQVVLRHQSVSERTINRVIEKLEKTN